jgi:hypothetical protein
MSAELPRTGAALWHVNAWFIAQYVLLTHPDGCRRCTSPIPRLVRHPRITGLL